MEGNVYIYVDGIDIKTCISIQTWICVKYSILI